MITYKLLQKGYLLFLTLGIISVLLLYASPVQAGDYRWTVVDPTGGQIYALLFDPTTPATLYVGTHSGGGFKSINGGNNWTPVNTGLTNKDVWSLTIDPAKPDTIYAGTWGGGAFVITLRPVFLPIIITN